MRNRQKLISCLRCLVMPNFNYTGNPAELSVAIPSLNEPVSFQGRNAKYGASLTLAQPIYSGGALQAGYDKAKKKMNRH